MFSQGFCSSNKAGHCFTVQFMVCESCFNPSTLDTTNPRSQVLHRNITEALRIHPPLLLVMRYAKQPFSVTDSKGRTYHVPAVSGC